MSLYHYHKLRDSLRFRYYRVLRTLPHGGSGATTECVRDFCGLGRRPVRSPEEHLRAAVQWLCAAQDATTDGGVARSYGLTVHPFFRKQGWVASYPETTGYIIPTFFEYGSWGDSEEIRRRAVRMADWESQVQMASGAVQGGIVDFTPSPAVFNTGQAIFGWVRAFKETGDAKYLTSAHRAGDFLSSVQHPDGSWRQAASVYAMTGVHTYDTRTAWSLLKLFEVTGQQEHRDACVRNLEFALRHQQPNGWLSYNCLSDEKRPLVHTIAYSLRGFLESGLLLQQERYVAASQKAADALLARQRRNGSLAGRYDSEWRPAARWSCLTGNSQMAIIWLRLFRVTGDSKYLHAARRINRFQMSVQNLQATDPGIRGGIKGSYPIYGGYGTYEFLNWGTKFLADALMLELRPTTYLGDDG